MKKLLLLALLATIMVGCENEGYDGSNVDGFDIIIVDSCEYIEEATYMHYIYVHKGNCRFCAERNKKMIKEQVDSILTEIFD